jgi:hypothetical protein
MNYNVTDKDGWTLAEGLIQRNREEAARIVERIERNQRIERLVRSSNNNLLEKVKPESNVVDFLHRRSRGLYEPMATRRNYDWTAAAIGAAIGIGVGFLSIIAVWIF